MTRSPAPPLPPPNERRRLREAHALTRAQLAERLGVRPDTVRAWESGRSTPRGRNRVAYAELLSTWAEDTARQTPEGAEGVTFQETAASDPTEFVLTPTGADTPSEEDQGSSAASEQQPVPRRRERPRPSWARHLRPSGRERASGSVPVGRDAGPYLTPAQAFDALYAYCAPALVRQAYLLTGRRDLAHESVERAFQRAWDHWPEVARDPDPAGWVRAASHNWALSPWHRFRRRYRHPEPPPPDEADRALLDALLSLPPPYRRTLVLYDGVGLDLPDTAAETEASTRAAAGRLMYAREALAERMPELADPGELHDRLAELASTGRTRAAEPAAVRVGSERRARLWTRTAAAVTVVLIGSTAMTLHTAPTHYEPPVPPGETVRGVPPRVAPGPLSAEQRELRDQLRKALLDGPERLTPQAR
ncbi:helix-turn-helix domain-containing protein [Streptomyces thermocarboxydus]|uniref:helix-turn-helix domain-containing protein n=1 Tax=Streptomyces thermocarboxydus TaxID=59299 RepID=UPI0025C96E9E|nr:helix-turn-helix domain-containing protein [Streptomyces thermocarboxydus]